MPNSAANYPSSHVLLRPQGTHTTPSGLLLDPANPSNPIPLLTHHHRRQFNSPNDVAVHSDGSIWFTDPLYGREQGFRPARARAAEPGVPLRPDVRAVADGFGRPNGLCFGRDGATVYVTDTNWVHGDETADAARASTM